MIRLDQTLLWNTEDDTRDFGRRLSRSLRPGDVVLLEGEIGAGKSFLARAVIRALCGEDTEVPSPTFTLVQSYQADGVEIWHADLYRLSDPDETVELGLTDAFDTAICLIEWPEKLGPYRPADPLTIRMEAISEGHAATFSGSDSWRKRLEDLFVDA